MVLISELTTANLLITIHYGKPTAAECVESLRGRMSEAERQVERLFESLLMDTFRVSLKERIDTKRGKNLYRVSDNGSPVLAT